MNNLNTGKVAVGLSLKVFEELLQEMQERDLFGKLSSEHNFNLIEGNDALTITAHIDVAMLPVKFRLRQHANGSTYTRLDLDGRVKLKVSSPAATSPDLFDLPFSIKLNIGLALKSRQNKAPAIVLQFNGIESLSGPLPEEKVSEMINSPEFTEFLNDFELDIIDPVIDGLEEVLFINETKPNHTDWHIGLHLMKGHGDKVDAYALIIDAPGGNANAPIGGSFVPNRSEIIVQFTKSMVEAMVEEAKEELKSWFGKVKGLDLRVSRLNLTLQDNQIYFDAKIKEHKYDATVTMQGPISFRHTPGGMFMAIDIRDVETDVDLPWWADILAWFGDIITFGAAGINNTIHNEIPNFAQGFAQRTLDNMLPKLSEALSFDSLSVKNVNMEIYPDEITLHDGALTIYVQVLIKTLRENLARADYSSLRDKFVMFHLETGRKYLVHHLATFMKRKLINVPGYHEVNGTYIRSNPDNTESNNLLKRYSR